MGYLESHHREEIDGVTIRIQATDENAILRGQVHIQMIAASGGEPIPGAEVFLRLEALEALQRSLKSARAVMHEPADHEH